MLAMKKRKRQVVSKEEDRRMIISSSTSSMNRFGRNSGPIPIDLLFEILSRLPAKSIARFRCVSKDWDTILTCPSFTNLFMKMSSNAPPRLLFTYENEGKWSFFSTPQCVVSDDNSSLVAVVDNQMHIQRDYSFRVCYPASGLLCTKDEWTSSRHKDARMMICNPSTRTFKTLPKVRTYRNKVITFLGYDPVENVHKVLCMTACEKPYTHKVEQHQVLSLGKEKLNWRMIECSVSYYPQTEYNEICINGVIYYIAMETGSEKNSIIVCFDVRSEKLKFIVDEAFTELKFPSTLIDYKGKLGVLHPNPSGFMEGGSTGIELWVFDDIEKRKWSRHVHILPPLWNNLVAGTMVYIAGIVGDSEIVFSPYLWSNPFYIFCFNMEKNTIKRVEIQGIGPMTKEDQYIYTVTNHVENVKRLM